MKYTAVFEPDEGGWHVHVPAVKGCRTWGRSIGAARKNIREALAVALPGDDRDEEAATVTIEEKFALPAGVRRHLQTRKSALRQARDAEMTASAATARAATDLVTLGLSLRDAGELLGLSHERVKQVARSPARRSGAPRRTEVATRVR